MSTPRDAHEAIWSVEGPQLTATVSTDSAWMQTLGPEPEAQLCAMLMESSADVAPVRLFLIGYRLRPVQSPGPSRFWVSALNATDVQVKPILERLSRDDHLMLHLVDEMGATARTLRLPNRLQAVAHRVLARLVDILPDSPDAYQEARDWLWTRYPTPEALWDFAVASEATRRAR